ncbi:MAG: nitrilase-related carbon-nitrogen hydrolase [Syntrophothermus sp.]
MRALLAQLTPAPGDPPRNAAAAAAVLRAHRDADLALFPELFLSGYRLADLEEVASDPEGPELRAVADACREAETAAIIGFVEHSPSGFRNAVACIDESGSLVATYRKAYLFGDEADVFTAGEWLVVVELAGRMVAPLICLDVEFPELARAAALAGADLLATSAANMEPFEHDHLIHTTARALENRIPHLYVNRGGEESGMRFVGASRSVDSSGAVVAEAAGERDEVVLVDVGAAGSDDPRVDYLSFQPTRLPVEVHSRSQSGGGTR